jgi:hypothetical protein
MCTPSDREVIARNCREPLEHAGIPKHTQIQLVVKDELSVKIRLAEDCRNRSWSWHDGALGRHPIRRPLPAPALK